MQGTFEYIRRTLVRDRLVQRYRPRSYEDGVHGGENAFAPCSFWAVEYLANAGQAERARQGFERLASYANDVGLFPQAFTHVSLVSAAIALYQRRTA